MTVPADARGLTSKKKTATIQQYATVSAQYTIRHSNVRNVMISVLINNKKRK